MVLHSEKSFEYGWLSFHLYDMGFGKNEKYAYGFRYYFDIGFSYNGASFYVHKNGIYIWRKLHMDFDWNTIHVFFFLNDIIIKVIGPIIIV